MHLPCLSETLRTKVEYIHWFHETGDLPVGTTQQTDKENHGQSEAT